MRMKCGFHYQSLSGTKLVLPWLFTSLLASRRGQDLGFPLGVSIGMRDVEAK